MTEVKALTFDVFGTVVDWRSSVVRELHSFAEQWRLTGDWPAFADAWRSRYQPSMEQVRSGARSWTTLDTLHRESLVELLAANNLKGPDEDGIDNLNRAWHRLDPWPDSVPGLQRLKDRYILATLSNGNIALLVNMAKRAGLPWDAVLGAEPARCYKRLPEAYLRTAQFLGLEPNECMMVAAHNDDLVCAASHGFRTAFVTRPMEHGPAQTTDLRAEHDFDYVADSFVELAQQLGV